MGGIFLYSILWAFKTLSILLFFFILIVRTKHIVCMAATVCTLNEFFNIYGWRQIIRNTDILVGIIHHIRAYNTCAMWYKFNKNNHKRI